jgi:septal ring factor EnvC (AmiA/AmiB activator)
MGNDGDDSFAMTDAELEYLESMEDVKVLANNLVYAQRAFDMVKSEIENQVQKLEHILERIDNESANLSSYDSAAGSDIGDDDSDTSGESQYAKEKLTRRVQRAELNAEVAMKEAQIAKAEAEKSKKEAERIRLEKEKELEDLQVRKKIWINDIW